MLILLNVLQKLEYILYQRILTNIPVVVCTFFLVGSYSVLLFKEIKKLRVQGLLGFRCVLEKEEATTINLAGKTERAHVNLLFSNHLHQAGKRSPNPNGNWYDSLKNWIYVTRPGGVKRSK
ncbi:uncharacterized protein LOC116296863 [Actinia tenebrosa]|uniref:Uncharacterized protein LOC116296863 n=1 Tax=Actinia tenebrosa TaxID=6105 RepID=A0A6P8HWQ7_ACTTE|nr:uncharacterized protein LOC116296863 [Actinia tenebrosa]